MNEPIAGLGYILYIVLLFRTNYLIVHLTMKLEPVLPNEFTNKMLRTTEKVKVDYAAYFKPYIAQAVNFAVGPYFWFIPDQADMTIVAASENTKQLSPYKPEEWVGQDANFWANNIHPDDRYYVLSASMLAAEINESYTRERSDKMRINIYCRMLDAKSNFRWVLIQFPNRYFDDENRIASTWIMITDLGHLKSNISHMMTVIDTSNNENQYFSVSLQTKELSAIDIPQITKREQEVLQLMARGLNSPEIAKELHISPYTAEQHKRNLRKKTGTKTSAELMGFVCKNNLF
jgi:DNA-binding CsgD family transcriptional regulator